MKVKRIICLLILIIEIFTVNVYATNISAREKNINQNNTSQNKTTKNNNVSKVTKKSDNADLKTLQISNGKLSPNFDKNITEYYTDVDLSVNKITTKVTLEDNKATVKVKGNKDLKEGENKIELTVTAESGKKKTYYIYVNKKSEEESSIKSENITETKNEKIDSCVIFDNLIKDYETLLNKVKDIKKKSDGIECYLTSSLMDSYITVYMKNIWMLRQSMEK